MNRLVTVLAFVLSALLLAGCNSESSIVKPVTPTTLKPSMPTDLTAIANDGSVTLNWSSSETNHRVYYTTTDPGESAITDIKLSVSYLSIGLSSGTNTIVQDLANDTPYYFVVTSVKNGVQSKPSNAVSAIPGTLTLSKSAPSDLKVTAYNTKVILDWSSDEAMHQVHYATESFSGKTVAEYKNLADYKNVEVTSGTQKEVGGLTNGTPYFFVVTSMNGVQKSIASNEKTAMPAPHDTRYIVHDKHLEDNVRTVTDTITKLMWKQCIEGRSGTDCGTGSSLERNFDNAPTLAMNDDTAGYKDWRVPTKSELGTLIKPGASNPAIDIGAFPGTPSTWVWSSSPYFTSSSFAWVTDFKSSGHNRGSKRRRYDNGLVRLVRSDVESAVPVPPPTDLKATAGDGSVNLTWSSDEAIHQAHYATESFSGKTVAEYESLANYKTVNVASGTQKEVDDLANGTPYFFVVTSVKGVQKSIASNEETAMPALHDTRYIVHDKYPEDNVRTVTDTITKLMWKQCIEGRSGTDCGTGSPSKRNFNGAEASAANDDTASYEDWRVPTIIELGTLLKAGASNPAIDVLLFPGTPSTWVWSSSAYFDSTKTAWVADFKGTGHNRGSKNRTYDTGFVRLVRSDVESAIPVPPPTDLKATAGDGSVNLTWSSDEAMHQVHYATESFFGKTVAEYKDLTNYDSVYVASDTQKEVGNLANGTPYFFVVTSLKGVQKSVASNEETAMPTPPDTRYIVHDKYPEDNVRTVTDTITKLMWKQCAEGVSGIDCETGRPSERTFDSTQALAVNDDTAGYEDWRVPTIIELGTLIKSGASNPAIDISVFPATSSTWFWSSSPWFDSSSFAWVADFKGSGHNRGSKHRRYHSGRVRLVRNAIPRTPTNLVASPPSSYATIKLDWESDEDEHRVYYATDTFTDKDPENYHLNTGYGVADVSEGKTTATIINLLTNDTTYHFVVTSVEGTQESIASNEETAVPAVVPTAKLNDTGITFAGTYPTGNTDDCTVVDVSAVQDCSHGRDNDDAYNDDSDGQAGFSFTKLSSEGKILTIQDKSWDPSGSETDGTQWSCVLDNVTGFVWEVKTKDGLHSEDASYSWDDASSYVETVNAENFCGGADWRLPRHDELYGIADLRATSTLIDQEFFPNTSSNTVDKVFWSSLPYSNDPEQAWAIMFSAATQVFRAKTDKYSVRLVRGKPALSQDDDDRYIVTLDGDAIAGVNTVTDKFTHLMWKQCVEGRTSTQNGTSCDGSESMYTWQEALAGPSAIANEALIAGYDDWRLPNNKELNSLVNLEAFNPAINTTVFPNIEASASPDTEVSYFWSSSPYVHSDAYSWMVAFGSGGGYVDSRSSSHRVRLVRDIRYIVHDMHPEDKVRTVTDKDTKLMWKQCIEGRSGTDCGTGAPLRRNLNGAEAAAASDDTAGYDDWRVPTISELGTLLKSGASNPAIDTRTFLRTPSDVFWSSTPWFGSSHFAWVAHFNGTGHDRGSRNRRYETSLTRLVRNAE